MGRRGDVVLLDPKTGFATAHFRQGLDDHAVLLTLENRLGERLHDARVKVLTLVDANVLAYLLLGPGAPVRTVGAQRIPHVHDGKDARAERNLLAAQAAWIAGPVPFFMMCVRNIQRRAQILDRGK